MPVTTERSRSVTSAARRAQIVAATIEVIAQEGYAQASFGRIAAHAGLSSTRLISYHFASKDELIAACVQDVMGELSRHMGRRVGAERTSARQLRAYIEGVVEFTDAHRDGMRALLQLFLAGAWAADLAAEVTGSPAGGELEAILRRGQADGEFRDFDAGVMAATVQRAVEGLPFQLQSDPDTDCVAWASELVTLFDLATRRQR
jgi:AcrR family transcriptional regulator